MAADAGAAPTVPSARLPGVHWGCKALRGPLDQPLSSRNGAWREDERIDPRIRRVFSEYPFRVQAEDRLWIPALDGDAVGGGEEMAPSTGLNVTEEKIVSQPDGYMLTLSVIRPAKSDVTTARPCVVYCHGGGMSHYSAFLNCFQTLGRLIAHRGIVCVLPEFRNSDVPSRLGEQTAPFPGGLSDCVSAVRWVHANAKQLGIDITRVVVAGESGGGNLAIATALRLRREEENLKLVAGVFAACPFIRGIIDPSDSRYPSVKEHAGIFMDYPTDMQPLYRHYGHGEERGRALHEERNIEAWPGYLVPDDLVKEKGGFPRCTVVLNEFDPLRDEGTAFYRTCAAAGVAVQCLTLNGTIHGIGTYIPGICPDITASVVNLIEALTTDPRSAGAAADQPSTGSEQSAGSCPKRLRAS